MESQLVKKSIFYFIITNNTFNLQILHEFILFLIGRLDHWGVSNSHNSWPE